MIVSRDPFAREEIHKKPVRGTCAECGGQNRHGKVWKFRVETDGGRSFEIDQEFCSKSCMETFHH
jgi:hypothetical protein